MNEAPFDQFRRAYMNNVLITQGKGPDLLNNLIGSLENAMMGGIDLLPLRNDKLLEALGALHREIGVEITMRLQEGQPSPEPSPEPPSDGPGPDQQF